MRDKIPLLKGRISPGGGAAEEQRKQDYRGMKERTEEQSRTYLTQQLENLNRVCVNVCLPGV